MLPIAGCPAYLIGVVFFIFGLVFGSFGNVLLCRFPLGESIRGRSHCPSCKKILREIDLIPVISFIFLRGRCHSCRTAISWQYPVIELVSGLLFIAAACIATTPLTAILLALAFWLLLIISVIDARTQGIPDIFSILFIATAFLYSGFSGWLDPIAILIGFGFFGSQWIISRGKWIGSGDVFLSIGLCALLGQINLVIFMLFSSYIFGAIVASALLLSGRITRQSYIAFGPFLALGTLLSLFLGERVMLCLFWVPNACEEILFFL